MDVKINSYKWAWSIKVNTREAIVSQEKSVIFVILSLYHFSGDPKLFTMCQSKTIILQTHKFGVFYKKKKSQYHMYYQVCDRIETFNAFNASTFDTSISLLSCTIKLHSITKLGDSLSLISFHVSIISKQQLNLTKNLRIVSFKTPLDL